MLRRGFALCCVVVALSACTSTQPTTPATRPSSASATPTTQRAWKVVTPAFSMKVAPGWLEATDELAKTRPNAVVQLRRQYTGWTGDDEVATLRVTKLSKGDDLDRIATATKGTTVTIGGDRAALIDNSAVEKDWMHRAYFLYHGEQLYHIQAWGSAQSMSDVDYMLGSLEWDK